jgi:SPP1 family predicted phage head-tail adaptor
VDITHLLNRTLEVWRIAREPNGSGGYRTTPVRQADVAAKVDQPSASERLLAMQGGTEHTHSVYLQPTADVRRGDQLRGDGQTFQVLSVVQPSTPIYSKAECQLIEREGA